MTIRRAVMALGALVAALASGPAHAIVQPPHDAAHGTQCLDCHAPYASLSTTPESQGSETAGAATQLLTDSSKAWTTGQWIGGVVTFTSGANLGQFRTITASTATTLAWSQALPAPAAIGDTYTVGKTTYADIATKCKSCHNPTGRASTMVNVANHVVRNASITVGCGKCHDPHNVEPNSGQGHGLLRTTFRWPSVTGPNAWPSGNPNTDFVVGSTPYNGVCESCHTQTSYHRNNASGNHTHNATADCSTCHTHKAGFAPSNCTDCHNQPQGSRRIIVGATGDFSRTDHHVHGLVSNADCQVCHDMAKHRSGQVRLVDPDQGNTLVYTFDPATPAGLENFCLNCHDSDGAAFAGGLAPFSDGAAPPNIKKSGAWTSSAHAKGGQAGPKLTCMGDGQSDGCHGNGHGSNLRKMLQPYTGSAGVDNTNEEEGFCYGCHTQGKVTNEALSNGLIAGTYRNFSSNITHAFGLLSSHPVVNSQPGHTFDLGNGPQGIECTSCHNPHQDTGRFRQAPAGLTPVRDPISGTSWGADPTQKIASWDPLHSYQAPLVGSAGTDLSGQPLPVDVSGASTLTATVLPSYTSVCLSCHSQAIGRVSAVDWTANKHGSAAADPIGPDPSTPNGYPLVPPYLDASRGQYFLDCTDCHEAHGSSNVRLVRMSANGALVPYPITSTSTNQWRGLCNNCHQATDSTGASIDRHHGDDMQAALGLSAPPSCTSCHPHGTTYLSCTNAGCHNHAGHL